MKKHICALLAAGASLAAVQPASAAVVWADLTSSGANVVSGTVGGTSVTFNGAYAEAYTNGGVDYWTSNWNSVENQPPGTDLIKLSAPGVKTITFGTAVQDVYLALNSWNSNAASFSSAFTVVPSTNNNPQGCGYWGCGTLNVAPDNLSFTSPGEFHGVLKFSGSISSLTFTDTNDEFWHGIQIGIGSVAAVPEPSTWAMMLLGFGLMGAALRRKNEKPRVRFAF